MLVDRDDVLSKATKEDVVSHNSRYVKYCEGL